MFVFGRTNRGQLRPAGRPTRIRLAAVGIAMTCVAALLSSCAIGAESADSSTIKIGYLAEQSGSYEEFGKASLAAAEFAIDRINADGGIMVDGEKRKVELVVRNTRSEPAEGAALAIELITQEGVRFVFGATGLVAPAVYPITDASKVLFFEASSAATMQIDDTDYMVATLPNTALRVDITMGAIKKRWPDTKSIAFLGTDEPTANAVKAELEPAAAKYGLDVVASESVPGGTTDFSGTLARIRGSDPDVLLHVADNTNSQATVITQSKHIGAADRIMAYAVGCDTAVNADVTDDYAANPLVGADLTHPRNRESRELAEHLDEALDGDLTYSYAAMWQYDFFGVLADAIERAGTADDVEAVRDELMNTDYRGGSGNITMADDRTAVFGFDVCSIDDGDVTVEHVTPRKEQ